MIRDISQTEPSRQCIPIGPDNPLKSINQLINQDDSSFKDPTINNYDQIFPNLQNNPQLLSPTNNSKIKDKDKDNEFLINRSYVVSFSPKKLVSNRLIKTVPVKNTKTNTYTLNPLIQKFSHIFESLEQQSELSSQLLQYYQILGFLITILLLIYPTLSITLDIFNATIPFIGIKSLEIILNLHLIKQTGKLILCYDVLNFLILIPLLTNISCQHIYLYILLAINIFKFQLYSNLIQKQYSLYKQHHQLLILLLKLIIILHNRIYLFYHIVIYCTHISVNQNVDQDYHPIAYINNMLLILNILCSNSNFVPQDQFETIYLIFMILFSMILYFYVLLQLINIYRIDDRQVQLKQYLIQNNKMNHHLRTFLQNQFQNPDLTDIIKNHSMLETINRSQIHSILRNYFHRYNNETLRELVYSCKYLEIAPNDIIIKQNDNLDKSIYFILEGNFAISTSYGQQMGLTDPQFGEYSFYTDQHRQSSIVSLTYGRLLKLDRQDFLAKLTESDKVNKSPQIVTFSSNQRLNSLQIPLSLQVSMLQNQHSFHCQVPTTDILTQSLRTKSNQKEWLNISDQMQKLQKSTNAFKACKKFSKGKQGIYYSESSSSVSSYDFNQLPYDDEYNNSQTSNYDSPEKYYLQEQQQQQQQQQQQYQQGEEKKIQSQSPNLYKFQISPIKTNKFENNNVQRDQRRAQTYNKTSILNVINEQVEDQYQSESESSSNQTNSELQRFSLNPQQDQMIPRRIISEYVEEPKQFQSQSQSQQFTSYDHLENIDIYNQDFEVVEDFDKMQNYKIYNPHNNYYNSIQSSNSLIESYNTIQMNTKKYLEHDNVGSQSMKIN